MSWCCSWGSIDWWNGGIDLQLESECPSYCTRQYRSVSAGNDFIKRVDCCESALFTARTEGREERALLKNCEGADVPPPTKSWGGHVAPWKKLRGAILVHLGKIWMHITAFCCAGVEVCHLFTIAMPRFFKRDSQRENEKFHEGNRKWSL